MEEPTILEMPDLREQFPHFMWRAMPHSHGHLVASDFADFPAGGAWDVYMKCGMLTRSEASIVFNCVRRLGGGWWMDIGAHTGWGAMHMAAAGAMVGAIEPMLAVPWFHDRFTLNTGYANTEISARACKSAEFFGDMALNSTKFMVGALIDGDHEAPNPLLDAVGCERMLRPTGCILLHDAWGAPVQEAVRWLLGSGFRCKWYDTAHGLACCYRGDFTPPEFIPDPDIDWFTLRASALNMPWGQIQ